MRFMPGHGPLQQAVEAGRRLRLLISDELREFRPVEDSSQRDEHDYEFFISVAGHLQVIMGDRNILLPCREVSEQMKVSPRTVSRFQQWGVEDKFLVKVKEHSFRSKGGGSAAEFRFDVSRYSGLESRAQDGTSESFLRATT